MGNSRNVTLLGAEIELTDSVEIVEITKRTVGNLIVDINTIFGKPIATPSTASNLPGKLGFDPHCMAGLAGVCYAHRGGENIHEIMLTSITNANCAYDGGPIS